MKETDIAWMAGIVEGEGCFCIIKDRRNSNTGTVKLQVEMTDRDIIDRIHALFGGNVFECNSPSRYKNFPNAKTSWRWTISKLLPLKELTLKLYPYLGNRRRAKCDEVLAYIDSPQRRHNRYPATKIILQENT